jgi:hypothetical protein
LRDANARPPRLNHDLCIFLESWIDDDDDGMALVEKSLAEIERMNSERHIESRSRPTISMQLRKSMIFPSTQSLNQINRCSCQSIVNCYTKNE